MKCPKCNQNPMSLVRFILKFNPLKVNCKNCGTKLKAASLIRGIFYGALIFGCALGFSLTKLEVGFDILLLVLAIVAIPAEYIAWKYGSYEMRESAVKPPEGSEPSGGWGR